MAEPYLSEIRLMSFNFPPKGWALCNGQLLPVNQNEALFALLGTTYGGNGTVTFGLPDLRGRVPIHVSSQHPLGERGGEEAHTLTVGELPAHTHSLQVSGQPGTTAVPDATAVLAAADDAYADSDALVPLDPSTVASAGGSQAHPNMQPYLTLSYCIALTSPNFPSRA